MGQTTENTHPGGLPGTLAADACSPPQATEVAAAVATMEIPGTTASGQRISSLQIGAEKIRTFLRGIFCDAAQRAAVVSTS